MGASLSTILNSNEMEIPTSKAVYDAIEELKISGGSSLHFSNIIVQPSCFTTFTAEEEYPEEQKLIDSGYIYRGTVNIEGVQEPMIPDAVFSLQDIKNAGVKISNQFRCFDGGVYIYTDKIPTSDIEILLLTVSWNGDSDIEEIFAALSEKTQSRQVTLTAAGWNSIDKTQTITVSGIFADETRQVITPTPALASQTAYMDAGILCTGQGANSLTFTASEIPTENIIIYVVITNL